MKTNAKNILVRATSLIFLLLSSFYMYDFYKCLSGFIANGFREAHVMLPMVLSFLLPVICFLAFFYDFYVKSVAKLGKIIFSALVIAWGCVNLYFIFTNFELYASNNALGVYSSLPSIFVHFPYDMIAVHFALIALHALMIILSFAKRDVSDGLKQHGIFKLNLIEYIALCVLAILVFVFLGSSIFSIFTSFENALYDAKFIYLVLWLLVIPIMNLTYLALKPERLIEKKGAKIAALAAGIVANLIFGALLIVFETVHPDFIVHIGKPLFLIAFSVSMPIEMAIIIAMMVIGSVAMAAKLIAILTKAK